jgi:hypothetical protein
MACIIALKRCSAMKNPGAAAGNVGWGKAVIQFASVFNPVLANCCMCPWCCQVLAGSEYGLILSVLGQAQSEMF